MSEESLEACRKEPVQDAVIELAESASEHGPQYLGHEGVREIGTALLSAGELLRLHFLIWSGEHQAYWRPKKAGYTVHREEAGSFPLNEVAKIMKGVGPEKKLYAIYDHEGNRK